MREVFDSLDTNKDGFLDQSELEEGMSKVKSEMRSLLGHQPDWEKTIEKCDQDGDGRINWEEFWTAAYDRAKVIN